MSASEFRHNSMSQLQASSYNPYFEVWTTPVLWEIAAYYRHLDELHREMPNASIEECTAAFNLQCEQQRLELQRICDFVVPTPLYVYMSTLLEIDAFAAVRPVSSRNLNECLKPHAFATSKFPLLEVAVHNDALVTTELYDAGDVDIIVDCSFHMLNPSLNDRQKEQFEELLDSKDPEAAIDAYTLPVGSIVRCLLRNYRDYQTTNG